jgi:predicted TIM-barrel fold metal-dependent hydrolase
MDRVIVVSVDSHAQVPPDAWPVYLEKRYHEHLPSLYEENEVYPSVMGRLAHRIRETPEALAIYDADGAYQTGGFSGVWDPDVRLHEMDREGIAGEFVYHGDHRAAALFHNLFNRKYEPDVCDAGIRAYHRWAAETFGGAKDRIFLVGAGGTGTDLGTLLAELIWISDHGFVGTYAPGFTAFAGVAPLFDAYWEPVWDLCEERRLPLFVHAGFGQEQGVLFPVIDAIKTELDAAGGASDTVVERVTREVFTGEFFSDVRPRRPMWQLMFGGVFDRHPGLRLIMTEVRADWLPATLQYLDAAYDRCRADLPAKRSPTEYWHTNCLTSLSFVHRAEIEMRHELGIETIAFGRDYPHNESTWPNTKAWIRDAFRGVPENELRLMLGENAIRTFELDREKLAGIASNVGPTLREVGGSTAGADPELDSHLIAHFDLRGGYLKPPEGAAKLQLIERMVSDDLERASVSPGARRA